MKKPSNPFRPGKQLSDLLPAFLQRVAKRSQSRSDLLFALWPEAIGSRFAPYTAVEGFKEQTLYIRVKTSTLYALLVGYEKQKLLQRLQELCPAANLQKLVFRFG